MVVGIQGIQRDSEYPGRDLEDLENLELQVS